MIEFLKRNKERTVYDVVSEEEIKIGDEFITGFNPQTKKTTTLVISEIFEQRKSRGTFPDESKRPFWAKVS